MPKMTVKDVKIGGSFVTGFSQTIYTKIGGALGPCSKVAEFLTGRIIDLPDCRICYDVTGSVLRKVTERQERKEIQEAGARARGSGSIFGRSRGPRGTP